MSGISFYLSLIIESSRGIFRKRSFVQVYRELKEIHGRNKLDGGFVVNSRIGVRDNYLVCWHLKHTCNFRGIRHKHVAE